MQINGKVVKITSGQVPTTTSLAPGELAYGMVNGASHVYGNIGDRIVEFTASGEPILSFNNQEELEEFLTSGQVPTEGWFASVAEEEFDSYIVIKLTPPATSTYAPGMGAGTVVFTNELISYSPNYQEYFSFPTNDEHGCYVTTARTTSDEFKMELTYMFQDNNASSENFAQNIRMCYVNGLIDAQPDNGSFNSYRSDSGYIASMSYTDTWYNKNDLEIGITGSSKRYGFSYIRIYNDFIDSSTLAQNLSGTLVIKHMKKDWHESR